MLDPAAFAAPASPINTSHCQTTIRWRKAHTTDRASGIRPQPKAMHRVSTLGNANRRSEEHTSELQSLMRISYAVFCLKKKTKTINITKTNMKYHHREKQEIYSIQKRISHK